MVKLIVEVAAADRSTIKGLDTKLTMQTALEDLQVRKTKRSSCLSPYLRVTVYVTALSIVSTILDRAVLRLTWALAIASSGGSSSCSRQSLLGQLTYNMGGSSQRF